MAKSSFSIALARAPRETTSMSFMSPGKIQGKSAENAGRLTFSQTKYPRSSEPSSLLLRMESDGLSKEERLVSMPCRIKASTCASIHFPLEYKRREMPFYDCRDSHKNLQTLFFCVMSRYEQRIKDSYGRDVNALCRYASYLHTEKADYERCYSLLPSKLCALRIGCEQKMPLIA